MPKKEKPDDEMESADSTSAIPEEIVPESSYRLRPPPELAKEDIYSDGHPAEWDDTDRHLVGVIDPYGQTPQEIPARIVFELQRVRSLEAQCFFCKGQGCDQVFVARTKDTSKIKAFAVHDRCVFDHLELQELASRRP